MSYGCSSPQTQPLSDILLPPQLQKNYFIADDGYYLPLHTYWPDGPAQGIVIALHGFNDYSNGFTKMCEYYVARNVACFAYDQRGFGQTVMAGLWPKAGRLQQDLAVISKLLAKQYPDLPIYVVGESMGGAVILTAMADNRLMLSHYLQGVVLLAPAVWARSTQPWYQRWSLWLAVHTFPDWQPTGKGLGIQATDNIAALRAMSSDQWVIKKTRIDALYGLTNLMDNALLAAKKISINSFIVYGNQDQVIPKKAMCSMLNNSKSAPARVAFKLYLEGYHMLSRDLQAENLFADSYQWMFALPLLNEQRQDKQNRSSDIITIESDKPISYCEP